MMSSPSSPARPPSSASPASPASPGAPLPEFRDPWRKHKANVSEEDLDRKPVVGAVGSTHPMDRDLLPDTEYVIMIPRAARALRIQGVSTLPGAIRHLKHTLESCPELLAFLSKNFNVTLNPVTKGFVMRDNEVTISVTEVKDAISGLNHLTAGIMTARMYPAFEKHLQKNGIETLLM